MAGLPTLTTPRLLLRPFSAQDASRVQELAGERGIAATTGNIPHPYEDGVAEAWIAGHQEAFEQGEGCTLAIVLQPEGVLVGAVSLMLNKAHCLAELGYWIGTAYWNQGYCTEAALAMIRYGFNNLGLNRIQARHMTKNPASGRVMQKAGMSYEGTLRQSLLRFGSFEDVAMYAVLKSEVESGIGGGRPSIQVV